jgi:hypothetical protein
VTGTLQQHASSRSPTSLAAAALIEAGLPPSTRLDELSGASVAHTLTEAIARELARLHAQLEEIYEGAFVETETGVSVELLVTQLERPRPWWYRWRHVLRHR